MQFFNFRKERERGRERAENIQLESAAVCTLFLHALHNHLTTTISTYFQLDFSLLSARQAAELNVGTEQNTEDRRQQTEDYTAARAKQRERENVENWRFVEMKDTASVAASIYKKKVNKNCLIMLSSGF